MTADTSDETTAPAQPRQSSGTLTQLYLGLVWLGTTMWVAHASITGSGASLEGALGEAAAALPGLVAAMLVTSASIASAGSSRFAGVLKRLLVGVGLGAGFGLISALAVRLAYGATTEITVLAIVIGVAGVLGGAMAALPNGVLEAALWGATWVFFAGVIFGVLEPNLLSALGGGPAAAEAAQHSAAVKVAFGQSIATGLLAGVHVSRWLQPAADFRSAWFALAGALPGMLLVGAELLTRAGGSSLADITSATDPAVVNLSDEAQLRHALLVLGIGAVLAGLLGARARRSG
jgi:hypothetical protein